MLTYEKYAALRSSPKLRRKPKLAARVLGLESREAEVRYGMCVQGDDVGPRLAKGAMR
jgi:hypothetical protein